MEEGNDLYSLLDFLFDTKSHKIYRTYYHIFDPQCSERDIGFYYKTCFLYFFFSENTIMFYIKILPVVHVQICLALDILFETFLHIVYSTAYPKNIVNPKL